MNKRRILVVEDERLVAKHIENMVRGLGYDVAGVAATGEDAVRIALGTLPDLVLMDIMLRGDMDGIAASEQIWDKAAIPVVYLTAYADEATLERAKVTDPFGYLLKPFEERELYTAIEMALYKHKTDRELKERERWLSTILTSIGDGVISTDREGRVTFINSVAEALTGRKKEDCLGRDLGEVLVLVGEKTGRRVPVSARKTSAENGAACRTARASSCSGARTSSRSRSGPRSSATRRTRSTAWCSSSGTSPSASARRNGSPSWPFTIP